MPSVDDKTHDGDDTTEPPFQLNRNHLHSESFSGMPLHVYPIPNQFLQPQQPVRSKRRQVKNACTHCQRACKKCDDARPCLRCVKYGISEECVDSQRKERKKGIKRGPYKKRDGKCTSVEEAAPHGAPSSNSAGPPIPYMPMPGYPPGFYGQYPPLVTKQGDAPPVYASPQYFLASVPHPMQSQLHGAPESDPNAYPAQGYYQTAVLTSLPYHPQYTVPLPNGNAITNPYPAYPGPIYHKNPAGGQGDMVNGNHVRIEEQEGGSGKAT